MSDAVFQPPGRGDAGGGTPGSWPYRPPGPPPDAAPPPDDPAATPARPPARAMLVGLLVGLLVGGAAGWLIAERPRDPGPLTIEEFPRRVLGLEREDLALTGVVLEDFGADFERQRAVLRFAHGADGAAVGYGGDVALSIVNTPQHLPLPRDASTRGLPAVLVSLDAADVSCVFHPDVGLYDAAVLQSPRELSATGLTECVLNDTNLGLRLIGRVLTGSDIAPEYADALRDVHRGLTG